MDLKNINERSKSFIKNKGSTFKESLMSSVKPKAPSAYKDMKALPDDQYGRFRDRINRQQVKRKVKQNSKYDKRKIFGWVAGIGSFIAGILIIQLLLFMMSLIMSKINPDFKTPHTPWYIWLGLLLTSIVVGLSVYAGMKRNTSADRLLDENGVINEYDNDSHIRPLEELIDAYPIFPDNGAHSSVSPSTLLSHIFLTNKGVPKVKIPKRYAEDTIIQLDDGDTEEYFAGDFILTDDGDYIYEEVPIINQPAATKMLENLGIDAKNPQHKLINPKEVQFDLSGQARSDDQSQKHRSLLKMMEDDWTLPPYETQRPTGVYLVDTAPVNTLVLAITRAGKGQTIIEPTIDMWTREHRKWNIIINDPKGELLKKFYVPATMRGYEVVQFNLINSMKTDIFNPLGYAVEAAREGRINEVAEYLTNLSDVFFPKDGGEDKVWPESAAAAFERSCLGLIDYYLEEEYEIRRRAELNNQNPQLLEAEINRMWGKVTLYNCFQFFLSLVSKKETNPGNVWVREADKPVMTQNEDGQDVVDPNTPPADKALLDLFFDATEVLPKNAIRQQIDSSNNTLKTMMQSEKMLSSVYGIATSGMRFFADPTIIDLTSGAASQNFDIESLSFPRRAAIRFSSDWMKKHKYAGLMSRWSAYKDVNFKERLDDKLFGHEHIIDKSGWAKYVFDGMFEGLVGYIKMEIINTDNDMPVKTFYFKAKLDYLKDLDGTKYKTNKITGERVIRNGTLVELRKNANGKFVESYTQITKEVKEFGVNYTRGVIAKSKTISIPAISDLKLKYASKPKMINFITPPHLMPYARLILILIKQVTDSAMKHSYMTKDNQKPLYGTKYMLDEVGNLQSDGHGIPYLETLLSIGLSAMQQFSATSCIMKSYTI